MTEIRQMTYQREDGIAAPVEVMTFDRLRALNDGGTQRADFHVLAVIDAGHGSVSIDFASYPLTERSAVWIAPGAVHRWNEMVDVAGHLVLFIPTAPVTHATRELVAAPDLVAAWRIPDGEWRFVAAARGHLQLEASAAQTGTPTELSEILLSALIARLRPPHVGTRSENTMFGLFRASVEAHFRVHRDVGYYARAVGYAPRTLSRAVQQVTGRTAKTYLTDRVVLEAKRLLAHDRLTAARCAAELGFRTASSFSVFFRNATGQRPGAWRKTHAGITNGSSLGVDLPVGAEDRDQLGEAGRILGRVRQANELVTTVRVHDEQVLDLRAPHRAIALEETAATTT